MTGYAPLHVHTEHSALDGMARIKQLFKRCAEMGISTCAVTDHHSLDGMWRAAREARAAGVRFMPGMEAYMSIGTSSRFDRVSMTITRNDDDAMGDADEAGTDKTKTKRYDHLTLLAYNRAGWSSLIRFFNATTTDKNAYWYKPRGDYELLAENAEGLIVLTGCLAGPVAGPLSRAAGYARRAVELRFDVVTDEELSAALRDRDELWDSLTDDQADAVDAADEGEIDAGQARLEVGERIYDDLTQRRQDYKDLYLRHQSEADDVLAQTLRLLREETGVAGSLEERADFDEDAFSDLLRSARVEMDQARESLDALIEAVGAENVYLEIMDHGIGAEIDALHLIYDLADEYGLPLVATNDSHYLDPEEEHAHEGFLCAGTKAQMDEPGRFKFNGTGYFMRDEQQMRDLRPDDERWQQAVSNSTLVADRLEDDTIPEAVERLPRFPLPPGFESSEDLMRHLVMEGLEEIGHAEDPVYLSRVEEEFEVINYRGFADYFLINRDVINWAKSDYLPQDWIDLNDGKDVPEDRERKERYLIGLGRGSGAGSLVAYTLGITGVDPIVHDLLFERFLEKDREGLPDIDTDYPSAVQGQVFKFLALRWGWRSTARIGSYQQMKTKSAIKTAARVLKPYVEHNDSVASAEGAEYMKIANRLSDLVPQSGESVLDFAALDAGEDPRVAEFWIAYEELGGDEGKPGRILEIARRFEDVATSPSQHPCGFIISPEPLDTLVPLRLHSYAAGADPDLPLEICWDGTDCDSFGLLKLDVLALESLDIAQAAMRNISDAEGRQIHIDDVPYPDGDDERIGEAWALLDRGSTGGVFQASGAGMTRLIQSFAPRSLSDLSVAVAAYRPGPMEAGVPSEYADRKHGRSEVSYDQFTDDPVEAQWLDTVLGETYGLFIYQEQLMRLGQVIAGFDASQRSLLRKAVGKKKKDLMEQVGQMLLAGAPKEFHDENGELISPVFSEQTAQRVYDAMKGSASYLFNKSHSVAYGYLAYVTSWLKAMWPVEYGAAILEVANKPEKRTQALASLKADRIEVVGPNVNTGDSYTRPVDGKVVLGLADSKEVGREPADAVIAAREAAGPFTSLHDLFTRVAEHTAEGKALSSNVVRGLIESGALDDLGPRMGLMMTLRAAAAHDLPVPAVEWDPAYRSSLQRARLGVSLGENVLDVLEQDGTLDAWSHEEADDRRPLRLSQRSQTKATVSMYAILAGWSPRVARTGKMANLLLEDGGEVMEGVIFPGDFKHLDRRYEPAAGDVVCVTGNVKMRTVVVGGDEDGEGGEQIQRPEFYMSQMERVHAPVATPARGDVPLLSGGAAEDEDVVVEQAHLPVDEQDEDEPDQPAAATVVATTRAGYISTHLAGAVVHVEGPPLPRGWSTPLPSDFGPGMVARTADGTLVIGFLRGDQQWLSRAVAALESAEFSEPDPMGLSLAQIEGAATERVEADGDDAAERVETGDEAEEPEEGVALAVLVSDMESFRFIAGQDELEDGYAPDLEVFEHLEPGMIVLLRQDDCDVLIGVVEHLGEGESMLDYLRDAADDLDAEGSPNWRFKASRGCWDG